MRTFPVFLSLSSMCIGILDGVLCDQLPQTQRGEDRARTKNAWAGVLGPFSLALKYNNKS